MGLTVAVRGSGVMAPLPAARALLAPVSLRWVTVITRFVMVPAKSPRRVFTSLQSLFTCLLPRLLLLSSLLCYICIKESPLFRGAQQAPSIRVRGVLFVPTL